MVKTCASANTVSSAQEDSFFTDGLHVQWDDHRIGWLVAGICAILTVLISLCNLIQHTRSYTNRREQRQILRIIYMPPVYAIISFFSYRFFREFTYYSLVEVAYEAVTISAFLLLLIEYVAASSADKTAESALARKEKTKMVCPFCCIRYRPTKPYFMYTLKWAVLQYVIVRPLVSVAGIVAQYYNVLCDNESYEYYWANVYLEAIDFVSISFALYGLICFYALTHAELRGKRPLAKFLCIKFIVMFTWYQGFLFDLLTEHNVIKATQFWTSSNIADGLNALCVCVEMVIFSVAMWWAYPASEYKVVGAKTTNVIRPILDSLNPMDFVAEILSSLHFFWDYVRGKPGTRSSHLEDVEGEGGPMLDFGQAFGLEGARPYRGKTTVQPGPTRDMDPASGVPYAQKEMNSNGYGRAASRDESREEVGRAV